MSTRTFLIDASERIGTAAGSAFLGSLALAYSSGALNETTVLDLSTDKRLLISAAFAGATAVIKTAQVVWAGFRTGTGSLSKTVANSLPDPMDVAAPAPAVVPDPVVPTPATIASPDDI